MLKHTLKQDIGISYNQYESLASLLAVDDLVEQLYLQFGTLHCPRTNAPLLYFNSTEVVDDLNWVIKDSECN